MKKQKTEIIYLSVPYTFNPTKSFKIANEVSAKLMNEGKVVLSPISHSHPIADYLNPKLRCDHNFWMNQDIPLLEACSILYLVVIGKDGDNLINNSRGCQAEIKKAKEMNININYYQYEE